MIKYFFHQKIVHDHLNSKLKLHKIGPENYFIAVQNSEKLDDTTR